MVEMAKETVVARRDVRLELRPERSHHVKSRHPPPHFVPLSTFQAAYCGTHMSTQ